MRKTHAPRLVVGDAGWAADLPEWLLNAVALERLIDSMIGLMHPEKLREEVGDAEVVCYLMTASLRAPIPSDLVEIYEWVCACLLKNHKRELTPEMKKKLKDGLSEWQQSELRDLRHHLWTLRGGHFVHPLVQMLQDLRDHPPSPQLSLALEGEPREETET